MRIGVAMRIGVEYVKSMVLLMARPLEFCSKNLQKRTRIAISKKLMKICLGHLLASTTPMKLQDIF
jgi:hypothetical protein